MEGPAHLRGSNLGSDICLAQPLNPQVCKQQSTRNLYNRTCWQARAGSLLSSWLVNWKSSLPCM